jgi:putative ABC transport system permease protein
MMLPKLALGNVKKSIRDYAIYFITIAFAVCVFYVFNSIESQQVMMETSPGQQLALDLLGKFMNAFSVFISAVLCFLIIYANNFLIKRRKKEFGIYLILGMEKGAISWILVMETVLVGIAGLLAGLLMGVFVSQGMALVTARMLNSAVGAYQFVFSLDAAIKTACYFGLTFLFTLAFNIVAINKQKLIDLLASARKNESFTPPHFARSIVVFILSLGCLGAGYYLMSLDTFFTDLGNFAGAVALAIVGTFLFFFSLSGFFLKLVQQRKRLYLSNLNMFVLRQINSKIHTNYVSMTFVCLMLTLAICALSSGTSVAAAIAVEQGTNAPYSASVVFQQDRSQEVGEEDLAPYTSLDVERALQKQGIDISSIASSWNTLTLYQSPVPFIVSDSEGGEHRMPAKVMRLSEYNALLASRGEKPLTLGENKFFMHSNRPGSVWADTLTAYLAEHQSMDFNGVTLTAESSTLLTTMTYSAGTRADDVSFVVPDEQVERNGTFLLPAVRTLFNFEYRDGAGDTETLDKTVAELFANCVVASDDGVNLGASAATRTEVLQLGSSATTIVAYIALYLGMVFLLASAALLAIAQLSEASDNTTRYRLLAKIGTEDKMLSSAIFSQVAIYFGAPLCLALVHSVVGVTALCRMFVNLKGNDIFGGAVIAGLVVLAIYGGYFLATYGGARGILNREVLHRLAQK